MHITNFAYTLGCIGWAVVVLVGCSLFEGWFHAKIMHRRVWGLIEVFAAHVLRHHTELYPFQHYHTRTPENPQGIKMWKVAGPALVSIMSLPGVLVWWLTGWWAPLLINVAECAAYFTAYEYSHWCMHTPKGRWIESTRLFRDVNRRHLRHHKDQNCNFNVLLPIWDILCRTLSYA